MILGFLTNANLSALCKGKKMELEDSDNIQRARILALMQFLRVNMLEPSFGLMFTHYYKYRSKDLQTMHHNLEKLRLKLRKDFKNMQTPSALEAILFAWIRALEIWISTIGTNIVIKTKDDVIQIWNILLESKPYLPEAIEDMINIANKTVGLHGSFNLNFPEKEKWIIDCDFVPVIGTN